MRRELDDLVTGAEAARRLHVSRERLRQWAERDDFPEPIGKIAGAILWRWPDLETWAAGNRVQRQLETESDGVRFIASREQVGIVEVQEPGRPREFAVAWLGTPLREMQPVAGGVLVRTARGSEGLIARNTKGRWTLHAAPRESVSA